MEEGTLLFSSAYKQGSDNEGDVVFSAEADLVCAAFLCSIQVMLFQSGYRVS